MDPLVVLHLGKGNCQEGLPAVTAQLWLERDSGQAPVQCLGSLPANPKLAELQYRWKELYEALHSSFWKRSSSPIEFDPEAVTNVSRVDFRQLCKTLQTELNSWLNEPGFRNIDQQLRSRLNKDEGIRFIIETEDPLLQKLPWHLWTFLEHHAQVEMAFSSQEYDKTPPIPNHRMGQRMRILVVLGDSKGLDIQLDRKIIEDSDAETVVLTEPKLSDLNQYLWDKQGWDILFFAGHSTSQSVDNLGGISEKLFLNATEQLSIDQLKYGLQTAVNRGLQLAIFNSCDGLGLARELADLNLPQLIVMREPILDRVAHTFLRNFLQAFSDETPFSTAVRRAREKLHGLENDFPGASWLPVIFQNPTAPPIVWRKAHKQMLQPPLLLSKLQIAPKYRPKSKRLKRRQVLAVSLAVTLFVVSIRALGLVQPLELSTYDHLMRSRPPSWDTPQVDSRLLVVEITAEDTDQHGYPVSDQLLAAALGQLQQHQPTAIGVDLHRYQPNPPGREQLIEQFRKFSNLITVCSFGLDDRKILGYPPEFSKAQEQEQVGFSDLETDDTFHHNRRPVVRRQLLSYDNYLDSQASNCKAPYSFSMNLAVRFLQSKGVSPLDHTRESNWRLGSVVVKRLAARSGAYQHLDGESSKIMLNYRFTPKPAQRVSFSEVLNGNVSSDVVRDRIVLIGVTDEPIGNDYRETPYGKLPGVWVHAHGISQLLAAVIDERPLIWMLPQWGQWQWGDMLWIWGWAMVGSLLAWRIRSLVILGIAGGVVIFFLHRVCLVILAHGGWLPLIPALLALVLTAGVLVVWRRVYLPVKVDALFSDLT